MTTARPAPRFAVAPARGGRAAWTITEDTRFDFDATWTSRALAVAALTKAKAVADLVAAGGYHQIPNSVDCYVFVGVAPRARVDVILPYAFTPTDRTRYIRAAVIRHLLDQEPGQ
jgi:hypothetical protein